MTYVFQAWARISNTLKEVPSKKISKSRTRKNFRPHPPYKLTFSSPEALRPRSGGKIIK